MTVLRYTVPPENEGCKLGLFLRMQGVTAGLIKSVKYDGDGFYADDQPSARMSCTRRAVHPLCAPSRAGDECDPAARAVFHRL